MIIEAKGLPLSDMKVKQKATTTPGHLEMSDSVSCSISQETEVFYTSVLSVVLKKNKTDEPVYVITCNPFKSQPKFHGGLS